MANENVVSFHADAGRKNGAIDELESPVRGIIFDLDGTLVDSSLDFEAIRRDMSLPSGVPILEFLSEISEGIKKQELLEILQLHERRGAERAVLIDGVPEFLTWLADRGIRSGVLTRNSRESTTIVLEKFELSFSTVITREDAPPKPDPAGLFLICRAWCLPPTSVVFCGDYLFDLEAGANAGMRTILFAPSKLPDFAHRADLVLKNFREAPALMERLS